MSEFRLAPAAEEDLEGIWLYSYREWGLEQANQYVDAMTLAFAEMAQAPESFPACNHIRHSYRRRHLGRHVVYFQVTSYGIAIIRILHDAMDAQRHL